MNSSDPLSDNEVAFAAINLFANSPTGAEPDWLEIEDWHAGLLDEKRADEVLSHVANSPECFQKWQDICEAEAFLEQNPLDAPAVTEQEQRISTNPAPYNLVGWGRKLLDSLSNNYLPAAGGAVAATLLAVLIVPKLVGNTPSNAGDMINASLAQYSAMGAPLPQTPLLPRNTRSLMGVLADLSDEEVVKHQLNRGLQQGFSALNISDAAQFSPWLESLPDADVDCSLAANTENCNNIAGDIATLGQWALVNHMGCQSATAMPKDFQERQANSLTTLLALPTINTSGVLQSALPTTVEDDSAALCVVSEKLISIASE